MTAPAPNTATVLALERTRVAYERTMMAWVRTGTSLIASPAVAANGVVVVGTLEGYLFAIGDTGA